MNGKATIIIALTASSFEEERAEILAMGCNDFLPKPFREETLFELMHKHLNVQFIYDDASMRADAVLPDREKLAALPVELRTRLEAAVTDLDIDEIAHTIDAVRAYDAGLA